MKNLYAKLLAFTLMITLSFSVNAQTKYNPNPDTKDTYKVTKIINLEYKYVHNCRIYMNFGFSYFKWAI